MGKAKQKLACRALSLLQTVDEWTAPDDEGAVFAELVNARSPLGNCIHRGTDPSFVSRMVRQLTDQGVIEDHALGLARLVAVHPAVAMVRQDSGATHMVQSVLVQVDGEDLPLHMTLSASIKNGRPPQVDEIEVEALYVEDDDRAALVEQVSRWHMEFPTPIQSPREQGAPFIWGWVGDPISLRCGDLPHAWEGELRALARVLGTTALVADSRAAALAMDLTVRADPVFVLAGTTGMPNSPSAKLVTVGTVGGTFRGAKLEAINHLITRMEENQTTWRRSLRPGEVIYHRKQGNNPHFDNFDEGSHTPCMHGAGSFERWSGDKCVKGMKRRWDNFLPEMLIHCKCGMYGVDASRLKPDND